jgi:DNA polymerase
MLEPETIRSELQRYLRQRLADQETERLLAPPPPRPAAARIAAAATGASPAPAAASPAAAAARPETTQRPSRTAPSAISATDAATPAIAASADSLERIAAEIAVCTKCRLHEKRNRTVPGVGPASAGVVFIGEGPGAEEDLRGEPFVGRAGELLDKIIQAIKFQRSEVFITNIVKCRPPGNRDPEPDEVAACEPFLKRQLAILAPKAICALGRHAGSWLAGAPESMASLRTGKRTYAGVRVFPTYHPAALLRNPQWKRPVWEDVQKLRAEYDRLNDKP